MPQNNEEYSPEDLVHALTIAVAVLYRSLDDKKHQECRTNLRRLLREHGLEHLVGTRVLNLSTSIPSGSYISYDVSEALLELFGIQQRKTS